jgi:hypothetical protein
MIYLVVFASPLFVRQSANEAAKAGKELLHERIGWIRLDPLLDLTPTRSSVETQDIFGGGKVRSFGAFAKISLSLTGFTRNGESLFDGISLYVHEMLAVTPRQA